ncbi:hypothetical protein E1176_01330 [Fulvivirga sp. RKSG066]|nr:hypothetical protein [Fulvivirga aurantia]MTI19654.1 hypothetical protein [Fulvivirga aurantia]
MAAVGMVAFLSACGDDDDSPAPVGGDENENVVVTENITANTTWTSDNIYELGGRISVESGATLTIEAGTIIKGQAGTGSNATALVVARGAKLDAQGTSSAPIIFTSVADEIESGMIASPNLDPDLNGLWGGLIILGNAPISADAASVQIEGIPPSDVNGLYGGSTADDNSGTIRYISIRHGGSNIGEGNEINGLTLGGVGSGTTIEYVEIVGNQDDGIECFGGTVNISNALVWNQGDDAYDMDQDYTGTIDNFIFIGGADSDHAMELDGPEGSQDNGGFTLRNGSLKGYNDGGVDGGEYIDFRSGVKASIENCYFFNFSEDSDVELDNDGVAANWLDESLSISDLQFDVSHLSAGNLTIEAIFADKGDDADDAFTTRVPGASIVTTATVGADKTKFTGWTWADANGELASF